MQRTPYIPCLVGVILCLVIASMSGWITASSVGTWYQQLHQPSFTPPDWLFGTVWTVLYIMIGIAGGLLWQQRRVFPNALTIYVVQLLLNFSWSFIFFGAQQIGWAAVDIVLLWLSIAVTLWLAWHARRAAFWWLVPYFLWVSFATILNITLWGLNS